MNALFFYFTTLNIMRKKRHLAGGVITEEQAKQITGDINKEQDSDSQSVDSLSGGAITEEQAKEIAEAMPNDILRTYVLPTVRYPLTDNVIHRAVERYFSPDPRRKNSVLQRFGKIENWDVSHVTNMSSLFDKHITTSFNQPIDTWDVSNVTSMNYMFRGATSFNQPLDKWDVSNVRGMDGMFMKARSFNQPLDKWDVSKVTSISVMFLDATSFNQPLNNWNGKLSNVTDMESMFSGATSFNQPLNNWDVSNVTSMLNMFWGATSFNKPLNNWNVSNVKHMTEMFYNARSFNQPLDKWDVSNVTDMRSMFQLARDFNQSLNNWNVSNVTDMIEMFAGARSFNQPLNNWNVSNVTDMHGMFAGARSFNQSLNNWNVSNVTDMSYMFDGALSFNEEEYAPRGFIVNSSGDVVRRPLAASDFLWPALGLGLGLGLAGTVSGGAITEEQAKEIAERMPNDILKTYVLPVVRYPLTDNVIRRAVERYFSPDPRQKNSVLQRFGKIENWDVSRVTDMRWMFSVESLDSVDRKSFNQPLNNWNVSRVTNMDSMFANARSFNQPLNNWDVSNVRNMASMFYEAESFNQSLDNWNVSKVTDMEEMFAGATDFNQPLDWKVSNVTNMAGMFWNATHFNQPLTDWDVSNVTDMSAMFLNATSFNQPLDDWDVSKVTNMYGMFLEAESFNQPLNNWNVSNVRDISYMFANATDFNQPLNDWKVSNVTDIRGMFLNADSFIAFRLNQPRNNMFRINNPRNEQVEHINKFLALARRAHFQSLIYDSDSSRGSVDTLTLSGGVITENEAQQIAEAIPGDILRHNILPVVRYPLTDNVIRRAVDRYFSPDPIQKNSVLQRFGEIENWDVSRVTNMSNLFEDRKSFNQPLNNWNVSRVTNMDSMFANATSFNQPLNNWIVSNVRTMWCMFHDAESFNQPLNNWKVSNVTNMAGMFGNARSFNQPLDDWVVSNVTNMRFMFDGATSFNQPLDNWNVSNVTDMSKMLSATPFNQPLNNWNVSNVTNMYAMFNYAINFNQPLNNWDVSNVRHMDSMFQDARSFDQPLNNWNGKLSNVRYMEAMFGRAIRFNQPLNNWDVSNVIYMHLMFSDATSFNQPLDEWDVSKVTDMYGMFHGATSFNQPLNDWDVSNVKIMTQMFMGATSFNQPLNNWDVSKVTDMKWMFTGATSFNQPRNNMFHGGATDFMDVDDAASEKVFMEVDNLKKNASPGRDFMDVDQIETTVSIEHRRYLYERWKEISADQCNIFASDVFKNIIVRDANSASDSIIIFLDIIYKGSSRNVYVPSAVIKMTFLGGTTNELEYETQVYSFLMLFKNPFVTQLIKNFSCSDAFSLCKSGIENNRTAMEQIINRIDSLNRKNAQYDYKKVRILLTERGTGSTLFQWNDSDYEWVCVLVQLLFCLAYFEDIGLMHHDLHLGNVLVEKTDKAVTYNLKISKTKFVKFTCNHIVKIYDFDRATVRKTKHQNISSDNSLLNLLCNRLGTCNKFTVGWDLAQVCWWLFNTKRDCPSIIKKFIKKTIDNRFLEMDEQLSWKGHSCVKQNAFGNILSTPGGINIGCKKIFNHKSPKHLLETLKFKLNIKPDAPLLSYELPSAGFP